MINVASLTQSNQNIGAQAGSASFNVDKFLEKDIGIFGRKTGFDANNADIAGIASKFVDLEKTSTPEFAMKALIQVLDKLKPTDQGQLLRTLDALPDSQTQFSAKNFVNQNKASDFFGSRVDINRLADSFVKLQNSDSSGFSRQALDSIMKEVSPLEQASLAAAIAKPTN
jgi:hypothetical protein